MPLPVIQRVLNGEQPLTEALRAQQTVLEQQAAQLAGSIRFCAELTQQAPQVDQLDVDDCLKRMQDPQEPGGFFSGWLRDYRTVAENEQKKRFSSYRNSPSTPRRILLPYCCAMGKLREAPSASQKGECTRSLSGTASDIRHGAAGTLLRFCLLRSILPGISPNGTPAKAGTPAALVAAAAPCGSRVIVLGALVLRGRM